MVSNQSQTLEEISKYNMLMIVFSQCDCSVFVAIRIQMPRILSMDYILQSLPFSLYNVKAGIPQWATR